VSEKQVLRIDNLLQRVY